MVRRELAAAWHDEETVPFAVGTTDSDAFKAEFKYDSGECSEERLDRFFEDMLLSHTNDATNGVRVLKFGYDNNGAGATCNIDLNQSFDGLDFSEISQNSVVKSTVKYTSDD